jgi:RNA 3'-terminal phosphate cyclase
MLLSVVLISCTQFCIYDLKNLAIILILIATQTTIAMAGETESRTSRTIDVVDFETFTPLAE